MGRTTVTKKRKKKAAGSHRPRLERGGRSKRRKPCPFNEANVDQIDYKQVDVLRHFMSDKGKIRSRRVTGCCRRHQNQFGSAIKSARQLALLPYASTRR